MKSRPYFRTGLALLGGILAAAAAAAGSFAMVLGYNMDSEAEVLPAMPWYTVQFFVMCWAGAALALLAGPVMLWRPRVGAWLGFAAVLMGVVGSVVSLAFPFAPAWILVTLPVTVAAVMGLRSESSRRTSAST